MNVEVKTKLLELSNGYFAGGKTIRDFIEWFASIDFSDRIIDLQLQSFLGNLELLATEISEGLRPETEFRRNIFEILVKETSFGTAEVIPVVEISSMSVNIVCPDIQPITIPVT